MYNKYRTNQYNLVCSVHKSILHSLQMLSSLRPIQVQGDEKSQSDFNDGQKEFYEFIEELYCCMLSEPDKYLVPTLDYDAYMQGDKAKKRGEREHATDTKECKLRNTFQQAIQFYPKYFYNIGEGAEFIDQNDYALVISKSVYMQVKESMMWTHIYKDNEQRYQRLKELGVTVKEEGKYCYISCKRYPKMFLGLWLLCKAKESKYKYLNYLRVDYQGILKEMPELEDIMETLHEQHQYIIMQLQQLLDGVKVKMKIKPFNTITSRSKWKVEYQYKGKNILGFYAEPDFFMICIYFNNPENITSMSRRLQEEKVGLYEWYQTKFPERLCKCRYNRRVQLGEEFRRICGFSNRAEIVNPDSNDLMNSIEIIKLFRGF